MNKIRGTITRRTDIAMERLRNEFSGFYYVVDFKNKLAALRHAGRGSARPSVLKELFGMLDSLGIEYEKGQDNDYYTEIVRKAIRQGRIPKFTELEERMLLTLFEIYKQYPSPEDYMKRLVDRLCFPEDGWGSEPLRLRILKQFIKYGDGLSKAGFGGKKAVSDFVKDGLGKKPDKDEMLAYVDDGVFGLLEGASKPQKKPDGKYGLLKAADDLASGKFRAGGATRKLLYLFAMAFGMTYNAGIGGEPDHQTDIVINLFRDYYTNNLMRFITEAYRGRLSEYELDPSGQGVNYKNFAETVYLYYIASPFSPEEKIRRSSEMIERLKNTSPYGRKAFSSAGATAHYRSLFAGGAVYGEDILALSEGEFEAFVRENYELSTEGDTPGSSIGVLGVETEQNTAYAEYLEILDEIELLGIPRDSLNYGLWFTEVMGFESGETSSLADRREDIDREKYREFMELLRGMNRFMGCAPDGGAEGCGKTRALFVSSPAAVTRTSLIVAYYYYYNALTDEEDRARMSFADHFRDFKLGVDPRLARAGYQPLSGRELFDLIVVFSSYAYRNI